MILAMIGPNASNELKSDQVNNTTEETRMLKVVFLSKPVIAGLFIRINIKN